MPNARGGPGRKDELTPLDKRIIEHLQADGRRPFTQIATDLGVSEAAVRARTNRLIERGIVQIVGVADPGKLGFQQALIGIRCEPGRLVAVAEALAALPEVDYVRASWRS
jgi:Lrp/AsnC family transcriptional regulator for asnA, asnC and gidA